MLFQGFQKLFFLLIISGGYNHGNHVACTEGIFDLLISNLAFTLLGGCQIRITVAVWTIIGKIKCDNYDCQEDRRNDKSRKHIEFTDCSYFRNQIFMLRLIN